jgi:hypothetical protein
MAQLRLMPQRKWRTLEKRVTDWKTRVSRYLASETD